MIKENIKSRIQLSLEQLYPDKILQGNSIGIEEVDFFMEQCVVTTKPDEVSSQQRVIAIIAAEWAKFSQNYNYKVSGGWFRWHDMMKQARAKIAHLPGPDVEGEARKLVKNALIQRYGKDAYDAAQNRSAFLVEHADWDQIDALAKSICGKFQIQPDQLTIMMVAGSQNYGPSPQVQGLCGHGHELRFCLVDDLEMTMNTWYFYDRESAEPVPYEIPAHHPNAPKPNLKDMLRESGKRIMVHKKASPVGLRDLMIMSC
jgi:hypothetical protein